MKYELETIPVWEALKSGSECLLCDLMRASETHAVAYYLGSSVMHPETRIEVNRSGFCPAHWNKLAKAGKPQALGLIAHTYLQETRRQLEAQFSAIGPTKEGRPLAHQRLKINTVLEKRESGCLVCSQMEKRLQRYAYTTVKLWCDDTDFRHAFDHGKGVCLHHMPILLEMAEGILGKLQAKAFSVALIQTVEVNLKRLEDEVLWMTQKYKAENQDKSWNGCEDAHKRVVSKLIGAGRVIDPV